MHVAVAITFISYLNRKGHGIVLIANRRRKAATRNSYGTT